MKVLNNGKLVEVKLGQKVLVARCGSGRTIFGEFGKLDRVTKNHMVFVTDSGAVVKTAVDNIQQVVGKAAKAGYFVSLITEGRDNLIHLNVSFWNEKKLCFENK